MLRSSCNNIRRVDARVVSSIKEVRDRPLGRGWQKLLQADARRCTTVTATPAYTQRVHSRVKASDGVKRERHTLYDACEVSTELCRINRAGG